MKATVQAPHLSNPLTSYPRLLRYLGWSTASTFLALIIGAVGYRRPTSLNRLDSCLNAAMIPAGMGPLAERRMSPAIVFAMAYCSYNGVCFVSVSAIQVSPAIHRLHKRVHIEAAQHKGIGA